MPSYQPGAIVFLGGQTYLHLCDATRDHVQRILAALPHDDRYTDAERQVFRQYLEQRLAAFQNDTETLDAVERRDFGYHGTDAETDVSGRARGPLRASDQERVQEADERNRMEWEGRGLDRGDDDADA
jgi:hypothetical protein